MTLQLILMLVCIGLVAGVLSGLIGIGGGIIMVPLLLLLGLSQQQAQGTSLAAMLPPVTLLAVISYHKEGMVNWKHALIISAVFIIGGFLGSKIALNINQKALRKIFAIVLLIVAGKLFFSK